MAKRGLTPGSKSPTLSNWIQWRDRAGFPPASHFALMRLCLMRLYTGPSAMSISVTATGARPQARLKPRLLSFEARRTEGEGSPGDTEGALIDGAVLEGRGLGELLGALREFTESGIAEDQLRWRHLGDQLSRRARGQPVMLACAALAPLLTRASLLAQCLAGAPWMKRGLHCDWTDMAHVEPPGGYRF